jgi:CelD/BcsL family acetyltransferase involved in cellulose biosynthesis
MNQIMALKSSSAGSGPSPTAAKVSSHYDAPISIDIRLLSACAEIRQDWSDLATRALESNLFFEPDFAVAATQHLVAFRDARAILAWQGEIGDPRRRLVGLIPCFSRNRLFVPDQLIGLSDPRILNGAPLLDAVQAQAVITAVLSLRRGWELQGRGLLLRRVDLESPLVTPMLRAAEQLGLSATLHPMAQPLRSIAGTRQADETHARRMLLAQQGKLVLVEASSRSEIRDQVELLLAMEASGPQGRLGRAVLQDTREVGFLRAMTRGLARTRQCRVALLTLDGKAIAGALVLGRARRGWLHLISHDETYAAFAPEQVLLAMMRQAAPARVILHPDLPVAGADAGSFGELRLSPQAALKPRDLASRARAALQRGLRLPRAGHA